MNSLLVQDLQFQYDNTGAPQIAHAGFEAGPGDMCMILGDNGSGKTTLGKLITGILQPQSGIVSIGGQKIGDLPVSKRPRLAVYMGQTSYLQFFRASIAEEIEFALKMSRAERTDTDAAYEAMHLPADRALKPLDLTYPEMWRLQLLLLAVVIAPAVLYIDELVAPSAAIQRAALDYVLERRRRAGQVTIIAYQRRLPGLDARLYALRDGRLEPVTP